MERFQEAQTVSRPRETYMHREPWREGSFMDVTFEEISHELSTRLKQNTADAIREGTCNARRILLPDIDLTLERHRREVSKLIASLANELKYEDVEDPALLILGARCTCHQRLADAFSHSGHSFRSDLDLLDPLQACLREYCDPPVGIRYQVEEIDDREYGVVEVQVPISQPVYYSQKTQDGRSTPAVYVRVKDEQQCIHTKQAEAQQILDLFLRYLRACQPFLDKEEWAQREKIFRDASLQTAFDLVRVVSGFLLADHADDRIMVVRAFGEVGGLSDSTKVFVAQLLLGMIADEQAQIVLKAIQGLSRVGGSRQAKLLLTMMNAIPSLEQRIEAVATLGEIGDAVIIDQLKDLQRKGQSPELERAIDDAITRLRDRHDLMAYDVASVSRFQTLLSGCEYEKAEDELASRGEDICEQAAERRWMLSLVRIARHLWDTEYDRAYDLAFRTRAEMDTDDNTFSDWERELNGPHDAWYRLRVSYFVLEKHFMNGHPTEFVERALNYCERLYRAISADRGVTFRSDDDRLLEQSWVETNPDVRQFFKDARLNTNSHLGRPAHKTLAMYAIHHNPHEENKERKLIILEEIGSLVSTLSAPRNEHAHRSPRISMTKLRDLLGSEPKTILRTLQAAHDLFAPQRLGPSFFDRLNADIRRLLLAGIGKEPGSDLIVPIAYPFERAPGLSTGRVVAVEEHRRYGYIESVPDAQSIFFHIDHVIDVDSLEIGQKVAFNIEPGQPSPRASRVTLVD